jgi:hypothetical protein
MALIESHCVVSSGYWDVFVFDSSLLVGRGAPADGGNRQSGLPNIIPVPM